MRYLMAVFILGAFIAPLGARAAPVASPLPPAPVHRTRPHPPPTPGHRLPVRIGLNAPPTPAPPAPVPITYTGGVLTEAQVASIIRRAGFEEVYVDPLVAIAWRESRFNPRAINPSSGACGLFQLYPCPGPAAFSPIGNAWLARSKCLSSMAAGYSCLRPWGG